MRIFLLLLVSLHLPVIGLGGPEAKGEKPTFFGTLTSQFTPTFNVTNIIIGYSRSVPLEPSLYEMPPRPAKTGDSYVLTIDPYKQLTTTKLRLINVSKIEVPEPQTLWIWTTPNKTIYEFIELKVTWNDKQSMHYLLELGIEKSSKPVKLFVESAEELMTQTNAETMFCPGIKKTNLREEGAPFASIKELVITGHCYPKPDNANSVKK